jgi:hypothetical protein
MALMMAKNNTARYSAPRMLYTSWMYILAATRTVFSEFAYQKIVAGLSTRDITHLSLQTILEDPKAEQQCIYPRWRMCCTRAHTHTHILAKNMKMKREMYASSAGNKRCCDTAAWTKPTGSGGVCINTQRTAVETDI